MPKPRRVALMLDLEWPYKRHAALFAGTQQYSNKHGWHSIVDEFVLETLPKRPSKSVPYDGIIARATKPLAQRAARLGVPLVNIWFSSHVRDQLPSVLPDLTASGRLRAEHLLDRGLSRLAALISDERGQKVEAKAFVAAVREAGFDCRVEKVPLNLTRSAAVWKKAAQRIESWMSTWRLPIGVYIGSEKVGRIVAQMCFNRGWRVPQDVAIVAGWNEETLCEHPRPSLSSVELDHEHIGYEAARLLDRLMDEKQKGKRRKREKKNEKPEQILLPPRGLVVRESSDFFAVDDEVIAAALAFIAANSHRRLAPGDVARAISIHSKTLHRRFDQVLGRGIAAEIRRVRIERAKRELTRGDRSMAAIARDVGFGPSRQMYEVFVRELGVTPTAYRKQRQLETGA